MSFLSRTTPIIRQSAIRARCFSTTVVYQKSATETVKDGLKTVDRTVSDTLVKGIDKGVEAKEAAKATVGAEANKVEGEASKVTGQAQGKASELAGQAKGKAQEIKGEVKAKM